MYLFLLFLCVKHWLKQRVPNTFFTVKMWKLRHWHFPEMPTAGVVEMDAVCFYLFIFSLQNTHQDESPPPSLILLIRQDRRSRVTATFPCVHLSFPQLLCEHLRWEGKKKKPLNTTHCKHLFYLHLHSHSALMVLSTASRSYLKTMHSFDRKSSFEIVVWKGSIELYLITQILYWMYSTITFLHEKKTYWNMQHTVQYWNHIQVQ